VSNEKTLAVYGMQGMNNYTVICGFSINHYKDPVIQQPGFNGK